MNPLNTARSSFQQLTDDAFAALLKKQWGSRKSALSHYSVRSIALCPLSPRKRTSRHSVQLGRFSVTASFLVFLPSFARSWSDVFRHAAAHTDNEVLRLTPH